MTQTYGRIMRKIAIIAALLTLTQLTGCVVHRYRSEPVRDYNSSYNTEYPRQYQEQYTTRYSSQNGDQYASSYQESSTEVAQIVDIRNISEVRESSGGGAVVGAILGGIIGNQLGRGNTHSDYRGRGYSRHRSRGHDNDGGRAVATVGGAIIGGVIGNELDRGTTEQRGHTEITIRRSNGQTHAVLMSNSGQFRVGDRVRVSYRGGRWMIV
jgi:outer membrane lipoprotein SlyB